MVIQFVEAKLNLFKLKRNKLKASFSNENFPFMKKQLFDCILVCVFQFLDFSCLLTNQIVHMFGVFFPNDYF